MRLSPRESLDFKQAIWHTVPVLKNNSFQGGAMRALVIVFFLFGFNLASWAKSEENRYLFKKYIVKPEQFSSLSVQIPNLRVFIRQTNSDKLLLELRPIPNLNEFQGSKFGKLSGNDLLKWQIQKANEVNFDKYFRFSTEEKQARLDFKLEQDKDFWKKESTATLPSFALFISGKALPLYLHWVRGGGLVKAWSANLKGLYLSGNFQIWDSKGDLDIHALNGEVKVKQHIGNVKIESHGAKISIDGLVGGLKINNFRGNSTVQGVQGRLSSKNLKGLSWLKANKGEVFFQNGHGELSIEEHEGSIKGNTLDGKVNLVMASENRVRIHSEEGSVAVKMGKNSGSFVNIGSEEGFVSFPRPLKLQRLANLKYAKGRLRGNQKGSLFIRNKKGDVKVYY